MGLLIDGVWTADNVYKAGRLPVDRLISRSVGFDDINEGFDRLSAGETVRQILLPHGV